MNNIDKYFKGQQTNETVKCFFMRHWISLVKEFIYFGIFFLIVAVSIANMGTIMEILRGNREMKLLFYIGFLVGTIYLHRFFIKVLNYFTNVGIITDVRLIEHQKSLFFKDTIDSIDMAQIQNIERVEEGIFQSIWGYGSLRVYLNASSATKTFHYMPNVKYHFREISRLKEARQHLMRQQIENIPLTMPPQYSSETATDIVRNDRPIPVEDNVLLTGNHGSGAL